MIRADCLHFRGDKPCEFQLVCDACPHYEQFPKSILIIKGRAQGDVFRTTALLPGLKRAYPESHITWIVDEESVELLLNNPYIDQLLTFKMESILTLQARKFDVCLSLDKEPLSTSLANLIDSRKKYGFGMNGYGNLTVFNAGAEYAYRLGIDDDLKFFKNKKSYQEIIYEIAEIGYLKDRYVFELPEKERKRAKDFFKKHKINPQRPAVGLNTGSGNKFETKQWPKENYLQLIKDLKENLDASIFLLGGKREKELNRFLEHNSEEKVYNTGNDNSLLEFAGFLSMMDVVLSSDTLGMHLAIAAGKKIVALFGPTCPQEIDLFGQGTKLFAAVSCSPCYKQTCPDGKCMKEITPLAVFEEIKKLV